MSPKKKETIYLSVWLTNIPCGCDVYMFEFVSLIISTCFRLEKNQQRLRLRGKRDRDKVYMCTCIAIIIAAFSKKDFNYRNNCGIQLHDVNLESSFMKEKSRCPYVFLPIFMFWCSRFSLRNLKDANSCMFS